jgi:hypothetical protein
MMGCRTSILVAKFVVRSGLFNISGLKSEAVIRLIQFRPKTIKDY